MLAKVLAEDEGRSDVGEFLDVVKEVTQPIKQPSSGRCLEDQDGKHDLQIDLGVGVGHATGRPYGAWGLFG